MSGEDFGERFVSQIELASALGLHRVRINQLVKDGTLSPPTKKGYVLKKGISEYMNFKISTAAAAQKANKPNRLQEAKALEIERKLAVQSREIIPLADAISIVDAICGSYLTALSAIPAKVTRQPRERQRIESIIDDSKARLEKQFSGARRSLETGFDIDQADPEDDAE